MSNFEKVKNALIIYTSQFGFPIELTSSDLYEFIPVFTDIAPISTSAISTVGRDNVEFKLIPEYLASYIGGGNWQIVTTTEI
jgi:hypothetical protein